MLFRSYKLIKLEEYTSDPVLRELLEMVGTGRLDKDKQAAQAAAWTLTDKMSWESLAAKVIEHPGGIPSEPYFNEGQLAAARQVVVQAQAEARVKAKEKDQAPRDKNRVPESKS